MMTSEKLEHILTLFRGERLSKDQITVIVRMLQNCYSPDTRVESNKQNMIV